MKKLMASIILGLLLGGAFFAETLSNKDAFYIYLKGTNYKVTEDDYLSYAKYVEESVYNKYIDDEFEWEDQFAQLKKNFDEKIKNAVFDAEYTVATKVEFGKYDSEKGGYVVDLPDSTFFPLSGMSRWAPYGSMFYKTMALKLDSLSSYKMIPMEKEEAKNFLQGRKDRYGDVNRSVMIVIKYKLAAFDSKEYMAFKKTALDNGYLPLVGIISEIEVYDTTNNQQKKIGYLVK